jgi:hypothetical protein
MPTDDVKYSATLRPNEEDEASIDGLDSEAIDDWMRTHGKVGDRFTYRACSEDGTESVRGDGVIDSHGDPAYRLST